MVLRWSVLKTTLTQRFQWSTKLIRSVHVSIRCPALAQAFVDSAVSKTCNVGDQVTFDEFKTLYYDAWKAGCKGITTFRAAGKRYGVLNDPSNDNATEGNAEACFIDPETGQRSCE